MKERSQNGGQRVFESGLVESAERTALRIPGHVHQLIEATATWLDFPDERRGAARVLGEICHGRMCRSPSLLQLTTHRFRGSPACAGMYEQNSSRCGQTPT